MRGRLAINKELTDASPDGESSPQLQFCTSERTSFGPPKCDLVIGALSLFLKKRSVSRLASTERLMSSFIAVVVAFLLRGERRITGLTILRLARSFEIFQQRVESFIDGRSGEYAYVQYHCNVLLCRLFKDRQLPESKEGWQESRIFVGLLGRVVRQALLRRDVEFIYSLQRGTKVSWLPPTQEKLIDTMDAHEAAFTRDLVPLPSEMVSQIRRTARRVFGSKAMGPPVKLSPSVSACYERTRANGGAASLFTELDPPTPTILGRMADWNLATAAHRQQIFGVAHGSVLELAATEGGLVELTGMRIAAVEDPAKYRLVSCHNGYLNTALQPLQGQLLSAWKKSRHSLMRDADATEKVNWVFQGTPDLPHWVSGDYKSATDLLHKNAGFACLDHLREHPLYGLAQLSLLGGVATYPAVKRGKVVLRAKKIVIATNGQAMGGSLSFPLLCVINLAAYERSCHVYFDEHGDRDLLQRMLRYVLINGDDILFRSNPRFYHIWQEQVRLVGLVPSQGKNYYSTSLCMINSQIFIQKSSRMVRKGYLNTGFMFGKDEGNFVVPTQLAQGLNPMLDLCKWANRILPSVFQYVGSRYGDFKPNWFIPVSLGGLGVASRHAPWPIRVTTEQRRMAARFKFNPELGLFRTIQARGDPANFKSLMGLPIMKVLRKRLRLIAGLPTAVPPWYEDIRDNGWVARACYIDFLRDPKGAHGDEDAYAIARRLGKRRDYKPMKFEKIKTFENSMWWSSRLPPCPTLPDIKVKEWRKSCVVRGAVLSDITDIGLTTYDWVCLEEIFTLEPLDG